MKHYSLILILIFLFGHITNAQNPGIIRGVVFDDATKEALPYANILLLDQYKGTISNEKGDFSLEVTGFSLEDTISFQYIGYQTKKILIKDIKDGFTIYLKEDLINLSEALVYGNPPNPKNIIKKVVENRVNNYKNISSKNQAFVRTRDITDIEKMSTDLKRNSIEELDEEMIQSTLNKIPKHLTSYTDFLGDLYFFENKKDSLKIDAERTVSLKEIEIAELDEFGRIFENLFKETEEEEYWKVKSGIFGHKLDIEYDIENDSAENIENTNDSTRTNVFKHSLRNRLEFVDIEDTKEWSFLYKPGKYNYTLAGGTRVNGEDVFIIDFTPKSGGEYVGRVYISTASYALIRADYEYAEGKTGRDFHLLGVAYTEDYFKASIYFEKTEDSYQLKYFSKKVGNHYSIHRNLQLIKKRKRWLMDKTLYEIKVKLDMAVKSKVSVEVLFLDHKAISNEEFAKFNQAKSMKIQYIDHFSDDLWKGYSIIEPTKQMREYKKQGVDWKE